MPRTKPSKRTSRKVVGIRKRPNARTAVPDDIVRELGSITHIPSDKLSAFRILLLSAQREAFRSHAVGRRKHLTVSDLRPHFSSLRRSLEALQPEREGNSAGTYLAAVIAPQSIDDWLDAVARAEHHAARGLPGRGSRKGPGGDTGFSLFTLQLVISARILGGELTCQRMSGTDHDKIKGSFADLLERLRDFLPDGFIPGSAHSIKNTFDRANKSSL